MSDTPPGYTLKEVWDSFNDLKAMYESGRMTSCDNYITIRLVTVIEQFCRVVYKHRRLEYDWKQAPPSIAIHILADIFQKFDPNIEYDECELRIRLYGKHSDKSVDSRIRLKSDIEVQSLVKTVLKKQNQDAVEWIRLYMLSFQSVKSIKDKPGVPFLTKDLHNDLNNLFGRRNVAVHTLSDNQVDKLAFTTVELLFTLILGDDTEQILGADRLQSGLES